MAPSFCQVLFRQWVGCLFFAFLFLFLCLLCSAICCQGFDYINSDWLIACRTDLWYAVYFHKLAAIRRAPAGEATAQNILVDKLGLFFADKKPVFCKLGVDISKGLIHVGCPKQML